MFTWSHQMFKDIAGISQPLRDLFGETATARGPFHNDDRSVLPSPRKIRNTEKEKRNAYERREMQKTFQNE